MDDSQDISKSKKNLSVCLEILYDSTRRIYGRRWTLWAAGLWHSGVLAPASHFGNASTMWSCDMALKEIRELIGRGRAFVLNNS